MIPATYDGRPCPKGHNGRRYRSSRVCVQCAKAHANGRRVVQVAPEHGATLESAIREGYAAGAYAVTFSDNGKAGHSVTLWSYGEPYRSDNGREATPTYPTHGKAHTAALDALSDAIGRLVAADLLG